MSAHLPPADIASEFKFFAIKFATEKGKNPSNLQFLRCNMNITNYLLVSEAGGFVNIFENAHLEDSVLLREPSYNAGRSLGLGLAESPILGPLQSASDVPLGEASALSPLDLPGGLFPTGCPSASPYSVTQPSSFGSPMSSASQYSAAQTSASRSSISSASPQLPQFDFQRSPPTTPYFS
jgi:hypothetical protein